MLALYSSVGNSVKVICSGDEADSESSRGKATKEPLHRRYKEQAEKEVRQITERNTSNVPSDQNIK